MKLMKSKMRQSCKQSFIISMMMMITLWLGGVGAFLDKQFRHANRSNAILLAIATSQTNRRCEPNVSYQCDERKCDGDDGDGKKLLKLYTLMSTTIISTMQFNVN